MNNGIMLADVEADLATQITAMHSAVIRSSIEAINSAIRCGELLMDAKAQIPRGAWGQFLSAKCGIKTTAAAFYVRMAAAKPMIAEALKLNPQMTISDARRLLIGSPVTERHTHSSMVIARSHLLTATTHLRDAVKDDAKLSAALKNALRALHLCERCIQKTQSSTPIEGG